MKSLTPMTPPIPPLPSSSCTAMNPPSRARTSSMNTVSRASPSTLWSLTVTKLGSRVSMLMVHGPIASPGVKVEATTTAEAPFGMKNSAIWLPSVPSSGPSGPSGSKSSSPVRQLSALSGSKGRRKMCR